MHVLDVQDPPAPRDACWVLPLVARIETWMGKVHRIAYVLKTSDKLVQWRMGKKKSRCGFSIMVPTLVELQWAEDLLVRELQKLHFQTTLDALRRLKVFDPLAHQELRSKSCALSPVNPFIDSMGLLRAGGRLGNSTTLTYDQKFPLILPNKDAHVDSLIRFEHIRNGHAGVNQVFAALKRCWYIMGGRETVRHAIHNCVRCQILFKQPSPPKMAELPFEMVDICVPFEVTGIDVFGPLKVKHHGGRAAHKYWVLILTCLGCRAVHMEILENMTSAAIQALDRFHTRHPGLRVIYSDNGSNFRSADRELRKAVLDWNNSIMVESLHLSGIEWKFGPPDCPWFGGIWERLIKTVKKHLSAILLESPVEYSVLQTVLIEVEGILNRRPLTYASTDPRDPDVLTPSDFLYPGVAFHSSVRVLPPVPPGGEVPYVFNGKTLAIW